jgi:hypothetical protein
MVRMIVIAVLATLLAGCWGAETQLFGRADWVQPPGMAGNFVTEDAAGETQGSVVLARRADGMIDGTVTRRGEGKPQTSPTGFVAIPGGSGRYFLMVNRAAEGGKGGEFYLIGRWQDERLEAFWPQCAGTPEMAGMKRDRIELVNELVCSFASKDAVLTAALLAERELETKRMFAPQLLGRLKRPEKSPAPAPEN